MWERKPINVNLAKKQRMSYKARGGWLSLYEGSTLRSRSSPASLGTSYAYGRLLELLLWPQLRGVSALLLPAVLRARGKASVTLAADLLLAVVLLGKHSQGRVNHTTAQAKDEMQTA